MQYNIFLLSLYINKRHNHIMQKIHTIQNSKCIKLLLVFITEHRTQMMQSV